MRRILVSVLTGGLLTALCFAQSSTESQTSGSASQNTSVSADKSGAQASSQASGKASGHATASDKAGTQSAQATASNQLAAGNTIQATLTKPVDARKNKPGDEVVAKTTQDVKSEGQVVIPKGSKIVGHVTEAKAKTKGESQSTLGIAFDHALLKDGREVPFAASIQAIGRAEQSASAATNMGDDSVMAGEGTAGMASGRAATAPGGVVGGTGRAVGTTGGTLTNTTDAVGRTAGGTLSGAGQTTSSISTLSSASRGVVGLNGLSLNAEGANSTQGSVISSTGQNVHLDSGTQVILQVSRSSSH